MNLKEYDSDDTFFIHLMGITTLETIVTIEIIKKNAHEMFNSEKIS